ncbi:MAG: hypothetical protein ABW036_05365, partial [Flavitalea sp.]
MQNPVYIFICCLFFVQARLTGKSQSIEELPVDLQIAGHYGFFMANQPKAYYLRNEHTRMLEFTVSRRTTGSRQWETDNRLPTIGVSGLFADLG